MVRLHPNHMGLAAGERFDEEARGRLGRFDVQALVWLLAPARAVTEDDFRAGDGELIALASHRFNEDGEVELTAAADDERVGRIAFLDAQGDVGFDFAEESLPELAAADELSFPPGEWRVIDFEGHLDSGLLDGDGRERVGDPGVGERLTDEDIRDASDGHDIAGAGRGSLHTVEAAESKELGNAERLRGAVVSESQDGHAGANGTIADATNGDAAAVAVVHQGGDEHAERRRLVAFGSRDVREDGLE